VRFLIGGVLENDKTAELLPVIIIDSGVYQIADKLGLVCLQTVKETFF
jgi:hypothetical protein